MKKNLSYILVLVTFLLTVTFHHCYAQGNNNNPVVKIDTTGNLSYPFDDEGEFQYPNEVNNQAIYLNQPSNIERKVVYDPVTKQYIIYEKIGDMYYRLPKSMNLKEYVKYDFDKSIREYWRTRKETEDIEVEQGGLIPQLRIESEAFANIFGSEVIDIRPQGYVEVQFGLESNYNQNNTLPERLMRTTTFDFENQINISVNGKIGDKVDLDFNYNTEATFDFENKMNLEYAGKEDEILRKIEAGNVSLPLNGSLIQGGTNLFGIKTEMQFGRLNVTTVISQNKGESQVIETEGGAQTTTLELEAYDYDENRHFFISKYFHDQYNEALSSLPLIRSKVVVNKIEVWITNTKQDFNSSRDIVAFVDLGETDENITNSVPQFEGKGATLPGNGANGMYSTLRDNYSAIRNSANVTKTLAPLKSYGFENGKDWEKIGQARKLSESEYTFNKSLGYISLNSSLNNSEVLAVAFNFTYGGDTLLYQVGELTSDNVAAEDGLILKLLKGTNLSPEMPTWELMMKNIYNLGAYGLTSDDFDFQVFYKNDSTNSLINYLPETELRDTILLRLMNLDNLDSQSDYVKNGDGMFDFLEGVTVLSQNGRVIFPVLEPFGANIADNISDPELKLKYAYSSIYNKSKTKAEQDADHNKYTIVVSYKGSSSSEISLNTFNLSEGSVTVTAGGVSLIENEDYVVDYALGRVKIINSDYIESGTPIQVSTESQELISTKRKTMIGSYANYVFSDKFNVGGTMLYMNERPVTNKVDLGEEPVSNLMLGLDFQYQDRSKLLTDIVNLLPFYESDVESSISMEGEVAKLFTGNSNSTGNQVYLDDFEGVETSYAFTNPLSWYLASTPQGQPGLFPESNFTDSLISGYNRAKLAWYYVDRTVFNDQTSSYMPSYLKADRDLRSNHYTRNVMVHEIYPGKDIAIGQPNYLTVLDLSYFPSEKGPYNFDSKPVAGISKGVDQNNRLLEPKTRWGGIMREINSSNFEASNVEYIEFWVLDPFIYDNGTNEGGNLYINLGNVSEDILKDSRKAFESGLPASDTIVNVDTTAWGRVSNETQMGVGFDNTDDSRKYQDIGLDGLNDGDEVTFFQEYLSKLRTILSPNVYDDVLNDPSNDNFHHYRGGTFDTEQVSVLDRYKNYNNFDGNSPTLEMSEETYSTVGRVDPDIEDINEDNTLNELEAYYQYCVSIRPEDMEVGRNYIVDKVARTVQLANQENETVNWYQFKIPVTDSMAYERIGNISDFRSIRFMRMFLTDFTDSVTLRFGTFNLVRSDWLEETEAIVEEGSIESLNAVFEMTSINIEENGSRTPINYILPPGIERETDPSNPTPIDMNEQSMLLKVKNLESGDAKAVYKDVGVDIRQFKRLRMAVHAEAIEDYPLNDYDVSLFVRLGTNSSNYYEYEIPLKLTPEPTTSYNGDLSSDRYTVWPEENQLDIALTMFSDLKLTRNDLARKAGATVSYNLVYEEPDGNSEGSKNIIRVLGNPSLGEVDRIYIGIRNPKRNNLSEKSVEVWVNELRMSDYEQSGGWASRGRVSMRLADLGSLSLAGSTQSVGWGSVSEAASQRSLEDIYQYDIVANVELGKLLPEKVGLHLPIFYSYSQSVASPEYNPLSSDIKMTDALAQIEDPDEKQALLESVQDVVKRKSISINNVMLEPERKKADRKALPTDIENFSVSYSKSEQVDHNIDIENYLDKTEKGVLNYNYSMTSKPITPFSKLKFLKPKAFTIIRDFNFNLLPEMISFRTDLTRNYTERTARDNTGFNIEMPTTVQKNFLWNRYFDLRYNLTRALSIDFTNQNISRIDELSGVMNKELDPDKYQLMMKEIWDNILSFGRPVDYEHSVTVNYRVPINKLPLLDWTSASVNYKGGFGWLAGPVLENTEESVDLGNTVGNNMNARLNGQLNFVTLYNKVPYLKQVNTRFKSSRRTYGSRSRQQEGKQKSSKSNDEPKKTKDVSYKDKKVAFRADVPKSIFHRLGTEKVQVVVLNERGDTVKGEVTVVDINRVNFKPEVSVREASVKITGVKEIDELFVEKALAFTTRLLLGVQTARVTYNRTGATELPGFMPDPYLFGMRNDETTGNVLAPTIPFLLGWQDEDFFYEAAKNGWLTNDNTIQKEYGLQSSETWDFTVQFEPIPNIKIDLRGTRRVSNNISSYMNYNEDDFLYELQNRKESGNFNMTILTLKTAFNKSPSDEHVKSTTFDEFRNVNRQIIANRLNQNRGWIDDVGYTKNPGDTLQGVSLYSPDVIIPALLAAYTGTDPATIPLTARPGLSWIRPNWRINYNGNPQRIEWMKDWVSSLNFNHNYSSTYSIGSYETNLAYKPDVNGLSWVRDDQDGTTFVPELSISSINIQEAFNPLINVDIGFVNDFSTRFEIRKTRNLNFDFANKQMSEMIKNEYSVGIGYRFTGLDMIIKTKRKKEEISNDINLRMDVTGSNYKNVLRAIDVEDGVLNGGTRVLSIDFTADYMASDKLTVKLYYQYSLNSPHSTINGNTQSNTKFGLSFNFSIL